MKAKLEQQLMVELSRRNIDLITQWAIENHESIDLLIDMVLSHKDKLAMRASWVLEKLSEKFPDILRERINEIIDVLNEIPESGTRRTIAKVLMYHTIPEDYEGQMLDFCITMLERPKEPVAVKANCMTIIFNLLPKYPDLKNEIFAIIEDQIPYHSVGFKSRFNVLKRRLK